MLEAGIRGIVTVSFLGLCSGQKPKEIENKKSSHRCYFTFCQIYFALSGHGLGWIGCQKSGSEWRQRQWINSSPEMGDPILQHTTAYDSTAKHNISQHITSKHTTAYHITAQPNTTYRSTTHRSTSQPNTTQHITTQHNTSQSVRERTVLISAFAHKFANTAFPIRYVLPCVLSFLVLMPGPCWSGGNEDIRAKPAGQFGGKGVCDMVCTYKNHVWN